MTFERAALAEIDVLYRVARRLTMDDAWAEDLVGQTFLLAAKSWHSFDGQFPRSWFIAILRNVYRRDASREARRLETVALVEDEAAQKDVCAEVMDRHMGDHILAELANLPDEYRLAVALCDVEELTYEEAGSAMDVPVGTVKSRLWRGRRLLRERLKGIT